MKKTLWFFNWIGGGYNTVMAVTREEAIEAIGKITESLKPDLATLVTGEEAKRKEKIANAYYSID